MTNKNALATPETFVYDNNGNLTSDGRWTYTWNENNRLVEIGTNTSAIAAGVKQEKYIYTYDWIGNKVKCEHYEFANNAWILVSTNKRYYDDYNLIYETTEYTNASLQSEVKKYYYGTDLLGSVYGTAGTGGLRMMSINAEDVYTFTNQVGSIEALYSAGQGDESSNGNASTQSPNTLQAEYIYSTYGEVLMKSGDLANKNNITYSTRYQESNTGLVAYTFRHYSPLLHKWINKDPIAEEGGVNIYGFCLNNPIYYFDSLGAAPSSGDPFSWVTSQNNWESSDERKESIDSWKNALAKFKKWFKGKLPKSETYYENSDEVKWIKKSGIASVLRNGYLEKFKDSICSEYGSFDNVKLNFKPWLLRFYEDLPNGLSHFVGSASGVGYKGSQPKPCKVNVRFEITNVTSIESFFRYTYYVSVPGYFAGKMNLLKRVNKKEGFMANSKQIFIWHEEFDCKEKKE